MLAVTYFVGSYDFSLVRAALLAVALTVLMAVSMLVVTAVITALMPVIIAVAIFVGKLAFGAVVIAAFGWVTYPRRRTGVRK